MTKKKTVRPDRRGGIYRLVDPTDTSHFLDIDESTIAPWMRPSHFKERANQCRELREGRGIQTTPWVRPVRAVFAVDTVIVQVDCAACPQWHNRAFAPTRPEWGRKVVQEEAFDSLTPDQRALVDILVEDALLADALLD